MERPLPPFLSADPMEGHPPCGWDDFLSPRLRRFPHFDSKVGVVEMLGYGIEGAVALVKFDQDPTSQYAFKIFYDSVPNKKYGDWWPLEREARNVAVLDKVLAGLRQSAPSPVYVPAKRTHRLDCLRCLYAFSAEGRVDRHFDGIPNSKVAIGNVAMSESLTHLRTCFGWMSVHGDAFHKRANTFVRDHFTRSEKDEASPGRFKRDHDYFAIVYEYVPETPLVDGAVQAQLDFLYHLGFQTCQSPHKRNWQGPGILLDFGDYSSPVDPWFRGRDADDACPRAEYVLHWDRVMAPTDPNSARPTEEEGEMAKEEEQVKEEEQAKEEERAKEEELAEERERPIGETACYIERGYKGGPRSSSYFAFDKKDIERLGLEKDALASIRIKAIKPKAVREAWKAYKEQRVAYLAQLSTGKDPEL